MGLYLIVSVKQRPLETQLRSYANIAIVTSMFCLTAFGGALTVAIYWANNKVPFVDFDMYEKMSKNTDWVKEELDLYLVNENILVSMDLNGKDQTKVFQVEEEIRDFQFSPDGKYILISTYTGIYVYDRANKSHWLVDSVSLTPDLDDVKGTISGISWSPTSKYFSYEKSRWSNFGSQSSVYVYQIDSPEKRPIKSPTMELSSLHWDSTGENLYFLKHGSNELDENKIIYKIQLYRIALSDLNVQLVTDISMDENKFPTPHLEMLGIHLYQPYKSLSYARIRDYEELVSKKGDVIGIDEYNFLYYKDKWFRKRLFKVKREVDNTKLPTYLNTQGEPVLQQIRWTPSGKYVVMDHPYWGILILDPKHRKIGQLYPFEVSAYGWYSKE